MTWQDILKDEKERAREQYPRYARKFMEATTPEDKEAFHGYLQMLERRMGVQVTPTIERREGSLEQSKFWRNA